MTRTAGIITAVCLISLLSVAASAADPKPTNLTAAFRAAGFDIDRLQVFEVGGVVLIRGRSYDKAIAEEAGRFAQGLGYKRIANLIQIMQPIDDRAIERDAERELTLYRSFEGCKFTIDSQRGVVRLGGTIRNEQQRDMALQVVRNIDGVREVRTSLERE